MSAAMTAAGMLGFGLLADQLDRQRGEMEARITDLNAEVERLENQLGRQGRQSIILSTEVYQLRASLLELRPGLEMAPASTPEPTGPVNDDKDNLSAFVVTERSTFTTNTTTTTTTRSTTTKAPTTTTTLSTTTVVPDCCNTLNNELSALLWQQDQAKQQRLRDVVEIRELKQRMKTVENISLKLNDFDGLLEEISSLKFDFKVMKSETSESLGVLRTAFRELDDSVRSLRTTYLQQQEDITDLKYQQLRPQPAPAPPVASSSSSSFGNVETVVQNMITIQAQIDEMKSGALEALKKLQQSVEELQKEKQQSRLSYLKQNAEISQLLSDSKVMKQDFDLLKNKDMEGINLAFQNLIMKYEMLKETLDRNEGLNDGLESTVQALVKDVGNMHLDFDQMDRKYIKAEEFYSVRSQLDNFEGHQLNFNDSLRVHRDSLREMTQQISAIGSGFATTAAVADQKIRIDMLLSMLSEYKVTSKDATNELDRKVGSLVQTMASLRDNVTQSVFPEIEVVKSLVDGMIQSQDAISSKVVTLSQHSQGLCNTLSQITNLSGDVSTDTGRRNYLRILQSIQDPKCNFARTVKKRKPKHMLHIVDPL